MKRAVIVHCWEGYPDYCWYPQVKRDLEKVGFKVDIPAMPETDHPQLTKWLPKLEEVAGQPDKDLYLIGHSAGCITILRWLEKIPEEATIGGVVFVAGFTEDLGYGELKDFFETPINWNKIKSSAKHFTAIHSDDDPLVDMKYGKIFMEKLRAKVIVKPSMKHFSGAVDSEEACVYLPEVVEEVERMSGG